jgi:predicted RNA binding protein YcfA (HicA-like mRNA interferase family)
MPPRIRELIGDLKDAGFCEIAGGGKGSHHNLTHARYHGAVTLSGNLGDDARPYQVRQVQRAIQEIQE